MIKKEFALTEESLALAGFIVNFPELVQLKNEQQIEVANSIDQHANLSAEEFALDPSDTRVQLMGIAGSAKTIADMINARFADQTQQQDNQGYSLVTNSLAFIIQHTKKSNNGKLVVMKEALESMGLRLQNIVTPNRKVPANAKETTKTLLMSTAVMAAGLSPREVIKLS